MQHQLFPVIIIIIYVDSFVSLISYIDTYNVLMLKGLERTKEEGNNASATTNSTLSRRKLPNGSPTVAEKRKLKRISRLNLNEHTVQSAVEAGIIILCKAPEDDCPTKTGVCAKWHEPNEFLKHWICRVCFKSGKYKSNAPIARHLTLARHIEWYLHNIR